MREELIRDPSVLADLPKEVSVRLNIAARIRKDEVVPTAQVLEQVLGDHSLRRGVRIIGVRIRIVTGRQYRRARFPEDIPPKLHQDLGPVVCLATDNGDRATATGPQELCRQTRIRQSGGQGHARHSPPERELDPVQQRLQLRAPFRADEGVQLIDDDIAQPVENGRNAGTLEHEQRFERLGRDQQ